MERRQTGPLPLENSQTMQAVRKEDTLEGGKGWNKKHVLSPFKLIQVESSIWWWGRARIRVGIQEEEKTGHCSETSQYGLFCSTKPKTDCLKGLGFRSALGLASLRSSLLLSQKLMNQKNSHPPQRAEGGPSLEKHGKCWSPWQGPICPGVTLMSSPSQTPCRPPTSYWKQWLNI